MRQLKHRQSPSPGQETTQQHAEHDRDQQSAKSTAQGDDRAPDHRRAPQGKMDRQQGDTKPQPEQTGGSLEPSGSATEKRGGQHQRTQSQRNVNQRRRQSRARHHHADHHRQDLQQRAQHDLRHETQGQ